MSPIFDRHAGYFAPIFHATAARVKRGHPDR